MNYDYGYQMPTPTPPPVPPVKDNTNRNVVIAVAAGLALLLIVTIVIVLGRNTGPADAAAAATSSSASSSASAVQTLSIAEQDATFYRWVLRHPWSENGNTQSDWTELAGSMCGAMDRGAQENDVTTILVDELDRMTVTDAEEFVKEAVTIYCPEYSNRVN